MNPDDLPKSPKETANPISRLFFFWLVKLFRLGSKRELELSDLYRVPKKDKSTYLGDKLGHEWETEVHKAEIHNRNAKGKGNKKTPSLLIAILKVFGVDYLLLGIFAFFEECVCKIAQPIFLGYLIRFFGGEFQDQLDGYMGYVFASGLLLGSMIYTMMHHPFFFATQHCGMRIRIACSSLIYRKSLKLSQTALGDTTIGQLVNLLSNDVNRFDICTGMLHYIWIGPLQLLIVIYILWGHFGWPCLIGVALLVLFVPFQSQMGRLFGKLRVQVAMRTDRRVRIMNEIISAMRVVKMYTWEKPFAILVAESREDEVKYIKKTAILRAINLSLYYISSKIIVFLTLLTYVLTGNYLTAEKVFVTLSLYNSVRLIMTLFFPNGISNLAEALVSINRLQTFLLMEDRELPPEPIHPFNSDNTDNNKSKSEMNSEMGVKLLNVSAKWNEKAEELTLNNISLEVKKGQLLGVIGPVGCGKGSLLQCILRELPLCNGSVSVKGKIAYTSQEAWIFGGSVKENIIFGSEFIPEKYDKVIKACALERDLTLLPYGDNTLVGDRGTSLSGGQKARLNLARAVYADADIYLLDDPLSAVDAEVGRHLFENCILGYLGDKARILVTHQLQFLKPADEIILLNGGRVDAQGTYTDLLKTGINFAQLLRSEDSGHASGLESDIPSSPSKILKYKGTGLEVLTGGTAPKPEFRRSASMSLLEMGTLGNLMVPEEFEWEEEPAIMRSYGHPTYDYDHRRMSKPLLPIPKKLGKRKASGSKESALSEETPLLPQVNEELRSTGDITLGLYVKYIRAGTSWPSLIVLFLSNILVQVLFSGSDYFLQYWTQSEEKRIPDLFDEFANETFSPEEMGEMDKTREMEVWIYSGIIGALFFVSLVRTAGFLTMCLTSSISLHKELFLGVLRAPMRFFEINPLGRVLNRFAKDCGVIDESLPPTLFDTMEILLQFVGVITIVCTVNPILLAPSFMLGIIFYFIRRFYLKTARSVKRIEGIARSPVFSHLSTSLYGLTTIRAFRVEKEFERQFDAHQDLHSSSWYIFLATARWLGVFVDWCSVFYIAAVTLSFLLIKQEGAAVGLAISSAMTLTGMFQWGVRQSAETENHMVSVERVLEYAGLEPEAPLISRPGLKPNRSWPLKGQIVMKNVSLRYGDEAPVLKDISCTFKPKEKVGIVGRTGAGKSSLITALFRIAEPCSGTIEIDGINVLQIGLHDLRSKISIIPQDPVLFIGTLRRNLDPFNDFDDDQLWQVLEDVHLLNPIREMPSGLDTQIAEGGSNFSVGQRQLICLGRAILRRNKILILDEATASVDPETDQLLQKTIREKFEDCTVLTVAHRLHTVMDSDRILVLDAGRIEEFDEPYKLLLNTKSSLHQLVQQVGKAQAVTLINIAKMVHDKRQNLSMSSVVELNESDNTSTSNSSEDVVN